MKNTTTGLLDAAGKAICKVHCPKLREPHPSLLQANHSHILFFIIQSVNRCPGLSKYNLPNRFLHSQTPGQILPHSGNIHSQTNLRKIYKLYHTTHTFGVTYCYLELRTGTSLSTRSHYSNCKPKISLLEGSKVPKGNVTTNVLKITNI